MGKIFSFIFIISFVIIAVVIIFIVIMTIKNFTKNSSKEVKQNLESQNKTLKPKTDRCEYCGSVLKETDSVCSSCGAKRTSKD